jgi:hypothetical protein
VDFGDDVEMVLLGVGRRIGGHGLVTLSSLGTSTIDLSGSLRSAMIKTRASGLDLYVIQL